MENQLFTTQQIAAELAVSDAYIRKLILQGKAQPKQRVGNTWVFTVDELERLRSNRKARKNKADSCQTLK